MEEATIPKRSQVKVGDITPDVKKALIFEAIENELGDKTTAISRCSLPNRP